MNLRRGKPLPDHELSYASVGVSIMDVVQVCVCVRVCNQLGTAVGQQQVGFYYVFFF